jgi:hypothetical protein
MKSVPSIIIIVISCILSYTTYYFHLSQMLMKQGRDRMVVGFTTTVQSVPITTKGVSSNPFRGEVYSYNIMW